MRSTEGENSPRPRRSDATRAAILEAARERFATEGYERATIRSIAKDAAIDPSMVMRYYGSKEGLFAAASEFDLRLPDLTVLPREAVGAALVGHFLDRWEDDETLNALLRVGVTHPSGAERIRTILQTQVEPLVKALCPDPSESRDRAVLIASQVMGMAMCRYVLRFPAATALGKDTVIAWLGPTVQRYLTAENPAPHPAPDA